MFKSSSLGQVSVSSTTYERRFVASDRAVTNTSPAEGEYIGTYFGSEGSSGPSSG